jgi:hypothetical protein
MLDPKTPRESYPIEFDFSRLLASITSASVTVTLLAGVDAAPGSILSGLAQISGSKVFQNLVGGVDGAKYGLLCQASDGTRTFELADSIEVREPMP